jgi:deoxyribonuclease V
MSLYIETIKLQEFLSKKVITKDCIQDIKKIGGTDVSYKKSIAQSSVVIIQNQTFELLESQILQSKIKAPYIPGFLMLRESGPILSVLQLLKNDFDVLLVDGNGRLHPRKCGLACYLGIMLDKPVIGVAKSLLCGKEVGDYITMNGEILGSMIEKKSGKKIFVSVGNKISLETATSLVKSYIKENQWFPEPLRLADLYSKKSIQKTSS